MSRIFTEVRSPEFTLQRKGGFIEDVNDISKVVRPDETGAAAENYQFTDLIPQRTVKSRERIVREGYDVC